MDWDSVVKAVSKGVHDRGLMDAVLCFIRDQRGNAIESVTMRVNRDREYRQLGIQVCPGYVEWVVADSLIDLVERGRIGVGPVSSAVQKRALQLLSNKSYLHKEWFQESKAGGVVLQDWGKENECQHAFAKPGARMDADEGVVRALQVLFQGGTFGEREVRPEPVHKVLVFLRIRVLDEAPHGMMLGWVTRNADLPLGQHHEEVCDELFVSLDWEELPDEVRGVFEAGLDCLGRRLEERHPRSGRPHRVTALRSYCPGETLTIEVLNHWLDGTRRKLTEVAAAG